MSGTRHPCEERPNIVSDIGLRLQEGLTDLHLEQQLAPTREAITNAFSAGSTNFFKAVDGVRGGVNKIVAQRQTSGGILPIFSSPFANASSNNNPTNTVSPAFSAASEATSPPPPSSFSPSVLASTGHSGGERKLRPLSLASVASVSSATSTAATSSESYAIPRASAAISAWGSSIGSFVSNKASRFRESIGSVTSASAAPQASADQRMSVSGVGTGAPNMETRSRSTTSPPPQNGANAI